ncbi:MAG: hypothetical protein COA79_12170 [Planctomycetota bacterium]|nr:MAG: hypothetical protein COA79_12170 [Planctomycetota bacterium]
MKKKSLLIVGAIIFGLLLIKLSVFQVSENETAVSTSFGKVLYEVNGYKEWSDVDQMESGIFFKIPFFQKVKKYDRRIYIKEMVNKDRLTGDEKNLNINVMVGWKIVSPKRFYESSDNFIEMDSILDKNVEGVLGSIVGKYQLSEFFSKGKTNVLKEIESYFLSNKNQEDLGLNRYGVKIKMFKITHIGFPANVLPAILERMKQERESEAAIYIAEGQKEAAIIQDKAQSKANKMISDARSAAKDKKSKAQKELVNFYKELSEDSELSIFSRKMEAIKKVFEGNGNKRFILDPEEFLENFGKNSMKDKK